MTPGYIPPGYKPPLSWGSKRRGAGKPFRGCLALCAAIIGSAVFIFTVIGLLLLISH